MVHVYIYGTPILYVVRHPVLHIPLINKSLQFRLYRIHTIPLVHPVPKKSFKYSIKEEYLVIRSDSQYISFSLSTNIMACQVSNGQFCCINSPLYVADTSKSCSYALFLHDKARINSVCILPIINQAHNGAININDTFSAISALQDDKKIIHNLFVMQLNQVLFPI